MATADFSVGEVVYAIGLDMQCRKIVVRLVIIEVLKDGRPVTADRNGKGIKVIGEWADLYKSRKDALATIR